MKETRFKDTEIGKIPEDWNVFALDTISNVKTGPFGSALHASDYVLEGTPIITVEHLGKIHIDDTRDIPQVDDTAYQRLNAYTLKTGDIVFSRVGSVDRCSCVFPKEDGWLFSSRLLRVRINKANNSEYLTWHLSTREAKQRILSVAVGLAMPSINSRILKEFKVVIPSDITEQNKIASALTSIDNLISSLDKLIEKKKNIKQGTMQQLLTGKKRLKSFTEPWIEQTLGSLGYFDGKSVTPNLTPNDIFCEYSMPSFDECQQPCVSKGSDMLSARVAINGEVLLVNKLNVRQKRIWYVKRCEDNAVCSGEFLPYKSNIVDLPLLRHILLTDKVVQDFIDMSTGTSNSQRRVRPKNILDYKVNIPTDKKEQIAIGAVLTSIDREISALEAKKTKYESVKQGMMQQLLTGKIRLI